eukprot:10664603-Ditylum_brightwellii.AAC.1
MHFSLSGTMRAAEEHPPAKPPWSTPTSTAHPLHSHPLDHTPTITANQENQRKRLTSTAPPPISIVQSNRKH